MIQRASVIVFLIWFVTTIIGVVFAYHEYKEAASVFLPIASIVSFYVLVFRIGRAMFNSTTEDDDKVTYGDLITFTLIWIIAVTNLLFMVWMWDPANAFTNLFGYDVSTAWLRLNFLALFLAPGVGQGQVQAASLMAEGVASYCTLITFMFFATYIGVGINTALNNNTKKSV